MNGNDEALKNIAINRGYENDYYNRLKLLALSIFKWTGLEDINCDSRFLEITLFEDGKAVFLKDPGIGYMNLKYSANGSLNVYELPTSITANSNGYSKTYDTSDVVLIFNNDLLIPTSNSISIFSKRLLKIQKLIDINLNAQKTPLLLQGSKSQELMLRALYQKYDGDIPAIFGDKGFDFQNAIAAIKTDVPYKGKEFTEYKHDIMSECLTFLGINNMNIEKKERLITNEIESNKELVSYYLFTFYNQRKKACDEINKKFFDGEEKIKVELNKEVESFFKENFKDFQNLGNNDIMEVDDE